MSKDKVSNMVIKQFLIFCSLYKIWFFEGARAHSVLIILFSVRLIGGACCMF